MEPKLIVLDQRKAPRSRLQLPVRLRWQGALRQTVEVAETLDTSRTGLLFYRPEPRSVHSRLWVTFPYLPEAPEGQAETPARVARISTVPGGGQLVALRFEPLLRMVGYGGPHNRRSRDRIPIALPVIVRPVDAPWPDEAMTLDVSSSGVLICTARIYHLSQTVRVTLPSGPWGLPGDIQARVVRIEPVPDTVRQRVALALLRP